MVQRTWTNTIGDNTHKIQAVLHQLSNWGKGKFGSIPKKIRQLQDQLMQLKNKIPDAKVKSQIKEIETNLNDVLLQEEVWWAQRAKTQWLKYGDNNTKFFHFKASQRKKKNYIYSITDKNGREWNDDIHIHDIFTNYFADIFSTSHPTEVHNNLDVISNRVPTDRQAELSADFTIEEVEATMKSMKATSAPGLDGIQLFSTKPTGKP